MKSRYRTALAAALVSVLVVAAGCSTRTVMETNWQLPGYEAGPYGDIAVVGVLRDGASDRAFESQLVAEFESAGVEAVPGFTILKNPEEMTQEKMERVVDESGVDALLISRLIAVNENLDYVQPTSYRQPVGPYTDWWTDPYWGYYNPYPYHYWGYWYPATQVVVEPGYWELDQTFRVETTLYRARDHRLVWTATSRTFDPMSEVDLARSLGSELVERLDAAGLIRAN